MPNVVDTVAYRFSDNDILQRVAEKLDDGSMAFKIDIVRGGNIEIGEVQIRNISGTVINPATEETLQLIYAALGGSSGNSLGIYDEAPSVPANTPTLIVSYMVPTAKRFYLRHIDFGGENIAKFWVVVDGVIVRTKRTWWSGGLNGDFFFESDIGQGLPVEAGKKVEVYVEHVRPSTADFEASINGRLVTI